jgi:hypothetical protein
VTRSGEFSPLWAILNFAKLFENLINRTKFGAAYFIEKIRYIFIWIKYQLGYVFGQLFDSHIRSPCMEPDVKQICEQDVKQMRASLEMPLAPFARSSAWTARQPRTAFVERRISVTRLGELSPIGRLFRYFGQKYWKLQKWSKF